MAGIDYTIPGQIKGIQIEPPTNAMARAMELRNLQETSQMNALKRQEAQEMTRQRNALAAYLANPKKPTDPMELEAGVRQTAPLLADQFIDTQLKREELGVRTKEREAKTEEFNIKKEERERALSREKIETAIADITSFDTVGAVLSDINRKVEEGTLKQDQADKIIAEMPNNDAGIPAWQIRTVRNLLSAKDRLAEVRAEKKDVREETRLEIEADRLKLEDARVQEQTRHANAMESIGRAGADRAQLQLEETQRHNKAMERLQQQQINKPTAAAAPVQTVTVQGPNGPEMRDARTGRLITDDKGQSLKPYDASNKPLTPVQQQKLVKDRSADNAKITAAKDMADDIEKNVDKLVGNPKKNIPAHPGLSGITGYNAMLPSLPGGKPREAQQLLDSVKGKVTQIGKSLASQEGKLGNMAVQEWKIVADAVERIDPAAPNFAEQLRSVVSQSRRLEKNLKTRRDEMYAADQPANTNSIFSEADAIIGR